MTFSSFCISAGTPDAISLPKSSTYIPVADVHDQIHMVLDKEDGQLVAVAYLAYELRKLQSFLRVHASRRLIEQQQTSAQ